MTDPTDDDIPFLGDDESAVAPPQSDRWKVLVVDDDESVHQVTTLTMGKELFDRRHLELIHAHSGAEAREILSRDPDIAIVLLDVVMETDDAGLEVVRFIRDDLGNHAIRIVLRTGQPGQAPERRVIADYDINDYKLKTELTVDNLFTVLQTGIRSYRYIRALERTRRGLETILHASDGFQDVTSMERFASGALEQLTALLFLDPNAVYCSAKVATVAEGPDIRVAAGAGEYLKVVGRPGDEALPAAVLHHLHAAMEVKKNIYENASLTVFAPADTTTAALLHLGGVRDLDEVDLGLTDVFAQNVATSFHNLLLRNAVEDAQQEIVYLVTEAIEARSNETGNHVKRVAHFCELMALGLGHSAAEAKRIRLAAPLHDIGKIAIPDAILNKPGKLTADEWRIMRGHPQLGHNILRTSNQPILETAATIALFHHEKVDGSGYPFGLKGDDIPLVGRITALADVIDALSNRRCYKEAWPLDRVIGHIREQRGLHFDPRIVDFFFDQLEAFLKIQELFPDAEPLQPKT
jgi:response regulator RpfG family c-di-GMP phosphodiesterase